LAVLDQFPGRFPVARLLLSHGKIGRVIRFLLETYHASGKTHGFIRGMKASIEILIISFGQLGFRSKPQVERRHGLCRVTRRVTEDLCIITTRSLRVECGLVKSRRGEARSQIPDNWIRSIENGQRVGQPPHQDQRKTMDAHAFRRVEEVTATRSPINVHFEQSEYGRIPS
jgi:hypothetical protein